MFSTIPPVPDHGAAVLYSASLIVRLSCRHILRSFERCSDLPSRRGSSCGNRPRLPPSPLRSGHLRRGGAGLLGRLGLRHRDFQILEAELQRVGAELHRALADIAHTAAAHGARVAILDINGEAAQRSINHTIVPIC